QVVSFKREVYRKVMKEFAPTTLPLQIKESHHKRRGMRRN
ncbi:RNA pyrophosphohydrolase, partial [Shewanella sp.]|nr:RNA pyrophosphohydrolase [Shewanella sp.]